MMQLLLYMFVCQDEAPTGIAASACLYGRLFCCLLFSLGTWIPLVVDMMGEERLERDCVCLFNRELVSQPDPILRT